MKGLIKRNEYLFSGDRRNSKKNKIEHNEEILKEI